MKKRLTILMTVLLLLLTACGQSDAKTPPQTQAQNGATAVDEIYVDEYEIEGTKVKDYYEGGKNGRLIRTEYEMPELGAGEDHYNADGKLSHTIFRSTDGSVYEEAYYPSGTVCKSIMTNPDGSYSEFHYADNGIVDEETMTYYAGTLIYQKEVAADGTVTYEMTSDLRYEEDGSYWQTNHFEDGSVQECHYRADGTMMEEKYANQDMGFRSETVYSEEGFMLRTIHEDSVNGVRTETEYYPNGVPMKMDVTYTDSDAYSCSEYYETGFLKHDYYKNEDGTSTEDKLNEAGFIVYSHNINLDGDYEYFADEEGNLVKYVEDGKVYEGKAIPSWIVDSFKMMQDNTQYRHIQNHAG